MQLAAKLKQQPGTSRGNDASLLGDLERLEAVLQSRQVFVCGNPKASAVPPVEFRTKQFAWMHVESSPGDQTSLKKPEHSMGGKGGVRASALRQGARDSNTHSLPRSQHGATTAGAATVATAARDGNDLVDSEGW